METILNEQTEVLVLIDDFIHSIAKQNIVETSLVIDRLLDIRSCLTNLQSLMN